MKAIRNEFYVYVLLNTMKPGIFTYGDYSFDYEPFYIGKGIKDRLNFHFGKVSLSVKDHKTNTILLLEREGFPAISRIYIDKLEEDEAYRLEVELIATVGRADKHRGPLTNLTDGGKGSRSRKTSVLKLDFQGNVLCRFDSFIDAALETGNSKNVRKIIACAQGRTKIVGEFNYAYANPELYEKFRIIKNNYIVDLKKTNQISRKVLVIDDKKNEYNFDSIAEASRTFKTNVVDYCKFNERDNGNYIIRKGKFKNWQFHFLEKAKSKKKSCKIILPSKEELIFESIMDASLYMNIDIRYMTQLISQPSMKGKYSQYKFEYL